MFNKIPNPHQTSPIIRQSSLNSNRLVSFLNENGDESISIPFSIEMWSQQGQHYYFTYINIFTLTSSPLSLFSSHFYWLTFPFSHILDHFTDRLYFLCSSLSLFSFRSFYFRHFYILTENLDFLTISIYISIIYRYRIETLKF